MKKILTLLVVLAVAVLAAYVAGYWPERRRAAALDLEKAQLQQQLQASEDKVRAATLLGELLTLEEVVEQMNYGQARGLSSPFFDHVRAEASRTTDSGLKQALDQIQLARDPVTIALTQGDASALGHLRAAQHRLRTALGYAPPVTPPPPAPAPTPAPVLPVPLPGLPAATPTPGAETPNPLGTPLPPPTPR
jgi:hypothetical protein